MKSLYFPFFLTIGGNLVYHVSQKSIPKTANPLITMMLAYGVGILLCGLGTVLSPGERTFVASVKESNWAVFAVGAGIAAVEVGYLLAYRAGWKLSAAPVMSSVAVALLLIPIGVTVFREHVSVSNLVGILLCIAGLFLVTRH